jgi:hypothetical protein
VQRREAQQRGAEQKRRNERDGVALPANRSHGERGRRRHRLEAVLRGMQRDVLHGS